MTEHTKTPWRVFTNPDGTKLVGIGAENGEGILDCGFGVWSWDSPEGIANAELVVKAVNNHDALVKALHIFLPPGNEPMEEIIWENQPDDAPMRITIKYGQYKKARKALLGAGEASGLHDDR